MKQKELLFLLISVTFVAAMWIVFSVVHQALSSTISDTTSDDIRPISGTFDTKTLENLKKREVIVPQTGIAVVVTPTATPIPLPPITPLQLFNIPVASQEGQRQ